MTLIKRKNKHVKFPKRNLNLLSFLHEKITRGNIIRNDPKTYPRVYFYLIYHQIIYAEKIVFKMPYLYRKILVQDGFLLVFSLFLDNKLSMHPKLSVRCLKYGEIAILQPTFRP